MDIPSTSSMPPSAGSDVMPSTSFDQSDFNFSSLGDVSFGESAVETIPTQNSHLLLIKWKCVKSVLTMVTILFVEEDCCMATVASSSLFTR